MTDSCRMGRDRNTAYSMRRLMKMMIMAATPIFLLVIVVVGNEPRPLPSISTRSPDHHLSPSPSSSPRTRLLFQQLDINRPPSVALLYCAKESDDKCIRKRLFYIDIYMDKYMKCVAKKMSKCLRRRRYKWPRL